MKLYEYLGASLALAARSNEKLWVLDADLADSDGAYLFAKEWPDRFIMTGIAEQNAISVAAGMATCGVRPFVFSFSAFLCFRAYDQIRVGISQTNLPVVLVGTHAGGCCGRNGKTHVSLNDIAIIGSLPGIAIWSPADQGDIDFFLERALSDRSPHYVRLPRDPMPPLPGVPSVVRIIREGPDLTVLSHGATTHIALEVARLLASQGINSTVLHCPRIKPFPKEELALLELMNRKIFVIEDHYYSGGLGAKLSEYLRVPVSGWFGWPETWSGKSGSTADIRGGMGLDGKSIALKITKAMENCL